MITNSINRIVCVGSYHKVVTLLFNSAWKVTNVSSNLLFHSQAVYASQHFYIIYSGRIMIWLYRSNFFLIVWKVLKSSQLNLKKKEKKSWANFELFSISGFSCFHGNNAKKPPETIHCAAINMHLVYHQYCWNH